MNIRQVVEEQTALIAFCVEDGGFKQAANMARELAETLDRHSAICKMNEATIERKDNGETA